MASFFQFRSPQVEPQTSPDDLRGISPALVQKLQFAQRNLLAIGNLSVMGGLFALVYMLLMATRMGIGLINVTYLSFLTGGAVAFALGLGLLHGSEAARSTGTMFFLAWGIWETVLGFISSAYMGDVPTGIFCIVGGVVQLVFADLLHLPAEVFFTGYANGSLEPQEIEEGLMKAAADKNEHLRKFLAKYQSPNE